MFAIPGMSMGVMLGGGGARPPRLDPQAIVARLNEARALREGYAPLAVGDIVTPRPGQGLGNVGEPHLVVRVFEKGEEWTVSPEAEHGFAGEDLDVELAFYSPVRDAIIFVATTGWRHEPWTEDLCRAARDAADTEASKPCAGCGTVHGDPDYVPLSERGGPELDPLTPERFDALDVDPAGPSPAARVVRLAEELCDAVDAASSDVGGARSGSAIVKEMGPLIEAAKREVGA